MRNYLRRPVENGDTPEVGHRRLHIANGATSTHQLRHDRWLARHQNVDFHLTPIHASWLKRVEVCFRLLVHTLRRASFIVAEQLRDAIHAFLAVVSW